MQYLSKFLILILLFTSLGCSKEALSNIGRLTTSQTQARLKQFPDLLALNEVTEGQFQLSSQTGPYRVAHNLPSKEGLLGVVYPTIGSSKGIDVGTLSVDASLSRIVPHETNSTAYGVYYATPKNMGKNDVYGKTVTYKLQKDNDVPVFKGEMYVPERIKFLLPSTNGAPIWSRKNGKITWTPDPNNSIGVGVRLTLTNYKTGKSRGDAFLIDDDGTLESADFLTSQDSIYNEISLTLYRGNGVVASGTDSRKYKLVVYSMCEQGFSFEP